MHANRRNARRVALTVAILLSVVSGGARTGNAEEEAQAPEPPAAATEAGVDRSTPPPAVVAQTPPATEAPAEQPPAPAAEKPGRIKVSGVLDAYIMHQFAGADGPLTGRIYDFRSNKPTLGLAWADIERSPTPGGWGFLVSLAVGDTADADHAGALDGANDGEARYKNLQQVYVTYQTKSGVTVDLGKFLSPYGFDTTKVILNPNYSMTLATFLVPNYQAGLRVTKPLKGLRDSFLQAYILTSIYHTRTSGLQEDNGRPSYGLRAKYTTRDGKFTYFPALGFGTDKLSVAGSGAPGDEQSFLFDNWWIYNLTDQDTLSAEYVYRKDDDRGGNYDLTGHGYGVYFRRQLTPKRAAVLRHSGFVQRIETFAPATPARTRFQVQEVTATYEIKHSAALTTRLEYRHDWTDNVGAFGFLDNDEEPTKKTQDTLALAFLFSF